MDDSNKKAAALLTWKNAYVILQMQNGISPEDWKGIILKHGSHFTRGKEIEEYQAFQRDIINLFFKNGSNNKMFGSFLKLIAPLDPSKNAGSINQPNFGTANVVGVARPPEAAPATEPPHAAVLSKPNAQALPEVGSKSTLKPPAPTRSPPSRPDQTEQLKSLQRGLGDQRGYSSDHAHVIPVRMTTAADQSRKETPRIQALVVPPIPAQNPNHLNVVAPKLDKNAYLDMHTKSLKDITQRIKGNEKLFKDVTIVPPPLPPIPGAKLAGGTNKVGLPELSLKVFRTSVQPVKSAGGAAAGATASAPANRAFDLIRRRQIEKQEIEIELIADPSANGFSNKSIVLLMETNKNVPPPANHG